MKRWYDNVASCGMDVHYRFSTVTFRDADGGIVRRERLDHRDRSALRKRLSQWPAAAPIVMEASFGWGWLSDEMADRGLDVHLSNCFKVKQMRKARGEVKTNRKDADLLSTLPFEPTPWWEVWLVPPDVREKREWLRYRSHLVGLQTQMKNRIHAIFHRHGIFHDFSDLFGTKGRAFLLDLCRDGSPYLSQGALAALRGEVTMLNQVRKQLADIAWFLKNNLGKDPIVVDLMTLPGIGLILAHTIVSEIGHILRFRNHRALASYSRLAPIANDTGEDDPQQTPQGRHLGYRGNSTLQWAFIEAAHGAVKHGEPFGDIFDRHTHNRKTNRNRGYIKVARQLVKIVYAIWRDQRPYSPVAPATKTKTKTKTKKHQDVNKTRKMKMNTRSGTGRLDHPMVVG